MNSSTARSIRASASTESRGTHRPQLTDDDVIRCQPSLRSVRSAAVASSTRRNSKIPTLVRHKSESGVTSPKTRDAHGDTRKAASSSVKHSTLTEPNFRRSSPTIICHETAGPKGVALSRIPTTTLRSSGMSSVNNASSSRKTEKSRHSSTSSSPAQTPHQRKPTSDRVVRGKSRISQSGACVSPGANRQSPRDDECASVAASPREEDEQELQSFADLIVQAFASAPLRSKQSSRSKAVTAQQNESETSRAQTVDRTIAETTENQQLDHKDALVETWLSLPADDMSSRQVTAPETQKHEQRSSDKISRQSPRSLSPASKVGSTEETKAKRQLTTKMARHEPMEKNHRSPWVSDKQDRRQSSANTSDRKYSNRSSKQTSPPLSPKARCKTTKSKRLSTTTTLRTTSEPVKERQASPRTIDEPDCRLCTSASGLRIPDGVIDSPAAEGISPSPGDKPQFSKVSQSSTSRKSVPPDRRKKCQDTNRSTTTSTTAKRLSNSKKLSPTTETGSTAADGRKQSEPSSPGDDGGTEQRLESLAAVDEDFLAESQRAPPTSIDDVSDRVRQKTSKGAGTDEPSKSLTDVLDDDDEETVTIAHRVDRLRQRIDDVVGQLQQSVRGDAGQWENGVDLTTDAWSNAAAADSSQVAMDADDIWSESFPLPLPFSPRMRKSRRDVNKSRGRHDVSADLAWTADSEYETSENDMTSQARDSPVRDLSLTEDSSGELPEHRETTHDSITKPPSRDLTWIKEERFPAEYNDEIRDDVTGPLRETARVVDAEPFKHDTSCLADTPSTELRRKTDTERRHLDDVVDCLDAMRRWAERMGRQVAAAGSEHGHRQRRSRQAEPELSIVGQVAASLEQFWYSFDVASRTDSRHDTSTTGNTIGTTVLMFAVVVIRRSSKHVTFLFSFLN